MTPFKMISDDLMNGLILCVIMDYIHHQSESNLALVICSDCF